MPGLVNSGGTEIMPNNDEIYTDGFSCGADTLTDFH